MTIRCGYINARVFLDVKDTLSIVTTSPSALKSMFGRYFSKDVSIDDTFKRFGVDSSHWRHVQWGAGGEKHLAGSLYILLPVLRTAENDVSRKLADELESRVGNGLNLETHGSPTPTPEPLPPPAPAPSLPAAMEADVAHIKSTLTSLTESIARIEKRLSKHAEAAPQGQKRSREEDESSALTHAKYEAELARANFERDHPAEAFAARFKFIRDELAAASQTKDTELYTALRGKLTTLVSSL